MAISDDLAVIRARTDIGDNEKRRLMNALKSGSLEAVLAELPGREFTVGGGPTRIRVKINRMVTNPVTGDLGFDLSIWRGVNPQVPLVFSNPLIITNPPILVPDGSGGFTEDLIAAGRQILLDFVARIA